MEKPKNKSFLEFFNIYNAEHLKAYKHLTITGSWPEGFIPVDCEMPNLWNVSIQAEMANAYVEIMLNEIMRTNK